MPTGESVQPVIVKLEIEVGRLEHTLKLIRNTFSGKREVLLECRVGLGASDFPTPVGVYCVSRIYDEAPWWIPPPSPWHGVNRRAGVSTAASCRLSLKRGLSASA